MRNFNFRRFKKLETQKIFSKIVLQDKVFTSTASIYLLQQTKN